MLRWAVRLSRFLRIDYPAALRELSLAEDARGRTRKALRLIDKSCLVAEQQGAAYEFAQSLLVKGQLEEKLGRQGGRRKLDEAEARLAEFQRQFDEASQRAWDYIRESERAMVS